MARVTIEMNDIIAPGVTPRQFVDALKSFGGATPFARSIAALGSIIENELSLAPSPPLPQFGVAVMGKVGARDSEKWVLVSREAGTVVSESGEWRLYSELTDVELVQ